MFRLHLHRDVSPAAAELMYIKLAQQLPEYAHQSFQKLVSLQTVYMYTLLITTMHVWIDNYIHSHALFTCIVRTIGIFKRV